MIVSILKMNWQKRLPLKTLQHFYVKIQQLYLRKSVLIGFQIGITKVLFITQRTFVFIVTIVKRPMPVEKSFSVTLNAPHVQPVIRPARTLKKNDVNDWTKCHMFAMAARKRQITARLHINTITTAVLLTENIVNC